MSEAKPPLIDLHYTVITQPLPDFIYEGLKEYSRNGNYYYHQPKILVDKLAEKHQLPPAMIFLTAGIDEAIGLLAHVFGQTTAVFTPTYIVYSDTTLYGGNLKTIEVLKEDLYAVPTKEIPGASLIFLANPNNPSGVTPKEAVLDLVRNNPNTVVVVDEAYSGFPALNNPPEEISVLAEVKNYKNLVVLRSFSKDYALAGQRIGYVVASPAIILKIQNNVQFANVSYLAVGAAVTALDHEMYFLQMRRDVVARREKFSRFLQEKGYFVYPSVINCVLLRFPTDEAGETFAQKLLEKNIKVNAGGGNSNLGLAKKFVRITIGTGTQMEWLMKAIEALNR